LPILLGVDPFSIRASVVAHNFFMFVTPAQAGVQQKNLL